MCYTSVEMAKETTGAGIIPERVKDLRFKRNLEPIDLAYRAGISEGYVYRIESKDPPSVGAPILARLADILDTSSDYLLGLTDNPARPDMPPPPPPDHDIDPETRALLDLIFDMFQEIRRIAPEAVPTIVNLFYMQAQSHLAAMRAARGVEHEEEPTENPL